MFLVGLDIVGDKLMEVNVFSPGGLGSWEFFDLLLQKGGVVGTPGAGFGKNGEGYFRLTGFGDAARTVEAAQRLKDVIKAL